MTIFAKSTDEKSLTAFLISAGPKRPSASSLRSGRSANGSRQLSAIRSPCSSTQSHTSWSPERTQSSASTRSLSGHSAHGAPRNRSLFTRTERTPTRRTTASGRASRSAAAWRQHPMNGVQRSLIDLLDAFCQDLLLHGATHPRERIECCVDSILYGLATVWANHETHLDGDGTVCALLVRMRLEIRAWLAAEPCSGDAGAHVVRLLLTKGNIAQRITASTLTERSPRPHVPRDRWGGSSLIMSFDEGCSG